MFMLRNLFGKVWSDPQASELAQIQNGALYLVRQDQIRSSRECIYLAAMASIRRTSQDFHYELAISRVFDRGEVLDEDEDDDSERSFLIDEQLEFRQSTYEGQPSFVWRDSAGDTFEFVANGANKATVDFFEVNYLKAAFERKHHRTSENVSDSELEALRYTPGRQIEPVSQTRTIKEKSANEELVTSFQKFTSPTAPSPSRPIRPTNTAVLDRGEVLSEEPAVLYLWSLQEGKFLGEGVVNAQLVETDDFTFWVLAKESGAKGGYHTVLAHRVSAEINGRWSKVHLSFTWNNHTSLGMETWCLKFDEAGAYQRFQDRMNICVWETLNEMRWGRIKEEEQAYAVSSWQDEDIEMEDAEVEDELEQERVKQEDEEDEEDVDEVMTAYDEDESEDEERAAMKSTKGISNSHLAVGHTVDRSFVVRGSKIGVFKHTDDDKIKYASTINKIATPKGEVFTPKKVMLHDRDHTMLLMNENNPNSLFRMDLERGKVVEEWKVDEDRSLVEIAPDSKFAQLTGQQTFVGTSHNALFRIDPRQSGSKIVDSQTKQYATKNEFSTVTTTQNGRVAVGSNKGELRLFDVIGKNAKTALPAIGDAIIGLDTTKDGRWVVATTKTYLMVVDTLIGAGRFSGHLGFDRNFPADAKPIPRRLQLRPEHVAYMGSEVSFTPARFNTGPDQDEKTIVTSSGPFVIAWDFKKVQQGRLDKYEIKQYADKVIEDQFKFGNDKNIVVALSNDVLSIDKKSLQRPTRASLSTPTKLLRTKSDIVNSPY
ncbi:VID27 cytoplasmic protein [Calocera viscosa TUFC12733]|uniref:VID27 cytoplasmic protein n=1 Tax=Calocera viscosa (strain TUFC12733) TaxID=1330018 RepID=A0A167KNN5_CALVF|nr:VID27 cytoplasmic protein [Calocera viscosa TUFC12733]